MSGFKNNILLVLKGMSMGAADVVPGVSGGTIALITGVYEELIHSLKSINLNSLKLLFNLKLKEFWLSINGNFLLLLFGGILISVFSLARMLKWILEAYPILIWSFFLGLIISSAILVVRSVAKWDWTKILALIIGIAAMLLITSFTPAVTSDRYWFIFLAGAIAICAMILPGISGAFILLILGKYQFILSAVSNFDIPILLVFGLGIIAGLLSFSRFLSFLLKSYRDLTIAVLAGFIIGSVNKIWPWKETISTRLNSHGDLVPIIQNNLLPWNYSEATGDKPMLLYAIMLIVAGIVVVFLLESLGKTSK
ncbi:MAG: DUF368 domain-containing protein [Bacteroidales bacterium]|nr:DUF368 domain-containing protein [Bacteroidales bacterium]